MAHFDPAENRLYARVVYDGDAAVGKTANLHALARLFSGPHDHEVVSPEEIAGRTMVLDWLEIHAGVVAGLPLVCQIVAVPGAEAFRARRQALVASADVVVRVCDSRAASLAGIRDQVRVLRARYGVPVVVQANQQDRADAVPAVELSRALGDLAAAVVDGIATTGVGVVDTFVAAVRVISRELSDRLENPNRRVVVGRPCSREATVADIARLPPERDAAAELYLEAAGGELSIAPADAPAHDAGPALPDDAVATGLVWPADTARPVLRRLVDLGLASARPRPAADGMYVHHAHDFVLETSVDRRFPSIDAAKAALVAGARAATQLEGLLALGTLLVAKESSDGAFWIWTARPAITSLATALDPTVAGLAAGPDGNRRTHLESYGTALALAVRVGEKHGLALALALGSFGLDRGFVRYVGPIRAGARGKLDPSTAFAALDKDDRAVVLAAFEREGARARAREDERDRRAGADPAAFASEAGTR